MHFYLVGFWTNQAFDERLSGKQDTCFHDGKIPLFNAAIQANRLGISSGRRCRLWHRCGHLRFGSAERFHEGGGKGAERYAVWLQGKVGDLPGCVVHVWQGEDIVGQIEMGRVSSDLGIGYVSLFYLVPERRGQGLGALLEAYAWEYLSRLGCFSGYEQKGVLLNV